MPYLTMPSTAPGMYSAFLQLVSDAAALQNPYVYVAPFELAQYEPAVYVILDGIENQRWEWAALGTFAQYEYYSLTGCVTAFQGDTPDALDPNNTVALSVMNQCYTTFSNCVMSPYMSNRYAPVLNAVSPQFPDGAVTGMLPGSARYTAGPGTQDGADVGWMGRIDWQFDVSARLNPQPA